MCMAYIDRLLEYTHISLHPSNWRRILLGALILASKVWEEQAVWNVDFLSLFPKVSVKDLNNIERHYLNGLKFNVSLSSGVYAKFYFELKSLSKKFTLQPLSEEGIKRLEEKSAGLESSERSRKINRTQSHDQFVPKSRPHIID
eukprot:TRINITY_DN416_c0_g1_i5.p1 TRINITY_DN416_c0_g1~~TRINITY_DN416_c0_g1_i5.p1  ORF type:complete len:144 (-),score=3.58 TRINITY_DN416_c0_g1_i5:30-461(-)